MTLRRTNWGRKERLSPQLWPYLGLSRRGLPGLTCHQAIADKFPLGYETGRRGEESVKSPNMLADVSHLVGAPQWTMVEEGRVAAESQLRNPVVTNWLFNSSQSLSRLFCPYQFSSSFSFDFLEREQNMVNWVVEQGHSVLSINSVAGRVSSILAWTTEQSARAAKTAGSIEFLAPATSFEQTLPPHKTNRHRLEQCK